MMSRSFLLLALSCALFSASSAFSLAPSASLLPSALLSSSSSAIKHAPFSLGLRGERRQRVRLHMQDASWEKKSPEDALALMQGEEYTYVDVRTSDEYAAAHPEGALNCQAFAPTPEGPMPMASTFVKLMENNFEKDAKLLIGCQSGKRSTMACTWLTQAGFSNLVEVETGFSGWSSAGLPVKKP